MSTEKKGIDVKYVIIVIIGLFMMFGFGKVVQPWAQLTPMGVTMLGVFLGMLILAIGCSRLAWPAIMACIATIWHGYMDAMSLERAIFAHPLVVQMFGVLAIMAALNSYGTGETLAKWIITRKAFQGRPHLFLSVFLLACFIGTRILDMGMMMLALSIWESIREYINLDKKSTANRFMLVCITICVTIGWGFVPFIDVPVAMIGAFTAAMEGTGFIFNTGLYMIIYLLTALVLIILIPFMMTTVFKCDLNMLKSFDASKVKGLERENIKFTKEQIILMIAFIVALGYSFVSMVIPADSAFAEKFLSIGLEMWIFFIVGVLGFVRIKHKTLAEAGRSLKEGADWEVILAMAAFLMLGGALSSMDLGIRAWLASIINPIFNGVPWPVFVFLVVVICVVFTNFLSNIAVAIMVGTIIAPVVEGFMGQGINPTIVCVMLVFSSLFAYITYASGPVAPFLLGHDDMEAKFVLSKGLAPAALYIIIGTIIFSVAGYIF